MYEFVFITHHAPHSRIKNNTCVRTHTHTHTHTHTKTHLHTCTRCDTVLFYRIYIISTGLFLAYFPVTGLYVFLQVSLRMYAIGLVAYLPHIYQIGLFAYLPRIFKIDFFAYLPHIYKIGIFAYLLATSLFAYLLVTSSIRVGEKDFCIALFRRHLSRL